MEASPPLQKNAVVEAWAKVLGGLYQARGIEIPFLLVFPDAGAEQ